MGDLDETESLFPEQQCLSQHLLVYLNHEHIGTVIFLEAGFIKGKQFKVWQR